MNIKNITTSAFCDCILRKDCSLSSNFEEEEITKSSLKIEEFVEVKKKNFKYTFKISL
jgi:hypothetical protein